MSAKPFSMGRLLRLLLPALVAAGSVDLDAIEVEAQGEAEAERAEASAPGVALEPADLLMISMVTGADGSTVRGPAPWAAFERESQGQEVRRSQVT